MNAGVGRIETRTAPSHADFAGPLRIVVLTYPCESAAMLLEHLQARGFVVAAVVLRRNHGVTRCWRLVRCLGVWRVSQLALDRLRAWVFRSRFQTWRCDAFYAARADRLVVVPHLNAPSCRTALESLRPDVALIGGAGILCPEVFGIPRFGTLNVHPGLLPRYRGCSPVTWAVAERSDTGVTVHVVDSGIDTGPIVAQELVGAQPGDTLATLTCRLFAVGFELVADALDRLQRGAPLSIGPQPEERSRYYRVAPRAVRRRAERNLAELARRAPQGAR